MKQKQTQKQRIHELEQLLEQAERKAAFLEILVARDLSTRKRMEEILIRTERLSAVGEMAAGVAHNFNNLLQMILGAGETALDKLKDGEIRKSRDVLLTLIEACHRGADIVSRIKDFTISRTDGLENAQVFDLGELVTEAVQLTKPLWANPSGLNKYTLNYTRPGGALVKGNPSELYEVLVNVIKNALEAMPQGGKLAIVLNPHNDNVHLSVTDSGMGIPEDNLQRVFQPFFTTKGLKSSGLGLSSSYGIVKKHLGDMTVRSIPGQGTTFTIVLPRAGELSETRFSPLPARRPAPPSKIKFLVIDDEKNILKMMQFYFEDSSIELTTATTAKKGLQAIFSKEFDLVLCDFSMDDMNGLQLCKAVKQHAQRSGRPKIPCLLFTGLNRKFAPDELARCGVDGIVRKPVLCANLICIIQETISRARLERTGADRCTQPQKAGCAE